MSDIVKTNSQRSNYLSHPLEVIRVIRDLKKFGIPIPEVFILKDPKDDHIVRRTIARIRKMVGAQCPYLIVVPST